MQKARCWLHFWKPKQDKASEYLSRKHIKILSQLNFGTVLKNYGYDESILDESRYSNKIYNYTKVSNQFMFRDFRDKFLYKKKCWIKNLI